MTAVHFKFSPSILARLGEELNQAPDQSILELVKNAYDADATRCVVELSNTATAGGSICINDDGNGMDQDAIRDAWLVLGKSSKSVEQRTALGRIPAGSKGLGRLAALRMGRLVSLESIKKGNSRRKSRLNIDWTVFDTAKAVEDVELSVTTEKWTGGGHGTRIELQQLREPLREDQVRRLARSLLLLTDPFADTTSGFQVELAAPEFKDVESLVRQRYFVEADYHLRADLDDGGLASVRLLDWRGNELAAATHAEVKQRDPSQPYLASKCTFDLWTFLLKGGEFQQGRRSKVSEIRQWLSHFGGVHVYQDSVRVAPYGDPGNDWLQINLARAKNPEERPSTNNSIGRVVIDSTGVFRPRQKTDRSGFIEDETFVSLTSFATDALDWMARWRLRLAEQRRESEKTEVRQAAEAERKTFAEALLKVPVAARGAIQVAFEDYEASRDREAQALRREVQLYRTLSTAGITAATFAHESQGNPLKVMALSVNTLRRRINAVVMADDRPKLLDLVGRIETATGALSTLGSATLGLVVAEKRRVGRVDLHKTVRSLAQLLEPFWQGRETTLDLRLSAANPYLRASEAAVESIFANLINNSLDAFRRSATALRTIVIETSVREKLCEITVADSGPGIVGVPIHEIWLPGVTTASNGTGLGLTIVRDTVKDLGGKVSATAQGAMGGAEFTISLPILGA